MPDRRPPLDLIRWYGVLGVAVSLWALALAILAIGCLVPALRASNAVFLVFGVILAGIPAFMAYGFVRCALLMLKENDDYGAESAMNLNRILMFIIGLFCARAVFSDGSNLRGAPTVALGVVLALTLRLLTPMSPWVSPASPGRLL